jgi:hypothetical protein
MKTDEEAYGAGFRVGLETADDWYPKLRDDPETPWPETGTQVRDFIDSMARVAIVAFQKDLAREAHDRGMTDNDIEVPEQFRRGLEDGFRVGLEKQVQVIEVVVLPLEGNVAFVLTFIRGAGMTALDPEGMSPPYGLARLDPTGSAFGGWARPDGSFTMGILASTAQALEAIQFARPVEAIAWADSHRWAVFNRVIFQA